MKVSLKISNKDNIASSVARAEKAIEELKASVYDMDCAILLTAEPNEKSPDPPEARKAIIEIERNVVFSALIDSELYMANKEFFEKYSFRSDFLGKIVTVINELSGNKYDLGIISVLEKYIEKYGGTRDDLKRLFAEGMERVPSLADISSKIALLLML